MLRDGRKLVGFLRSYDQFANLVFTDVVERILVADKYGDVDRGSFLIRGENVVLVGETSNVRLHDVTLALQRALSREADWF